MGQKSASLLFDRILSSSDYAALTEEVETQLIVRESTVRRKVYPH
jgi:hypothetical protein